MRRGLALASVLTAGLLGEFAYALLFLPLLQHYLVFERRLGVAAPGYTLAVYGLARLVGQLPLGAVANRLNRRFVLTAGYLVVSLAGLVLWAPLPLAALLVAAALFGCGHAIADPLIPAALAEGVDNRLRGQAMAWLNLTQVAGLAGGIAGGAFIADLAPAAASFLLVAAANGVSLFLLTVGAEPFLRLRPLHTLARPTSMRRALTDNRVLHILVVLFALALAANLLEPDLSFYAVQHLGVELHVLTLYLVPAAVAGVAALPVGGWLSDRYGRLPPLMGGAAIGGAGVLALVFVQSPLEAGFGALLGATGLALTMPASSAALLDTGDPVHRALLLSGMMAVQGLAEAVGPLASGLLAQSGGAGLPLIAAASALWLSLPATVLFASAPHDGEPGQIVPYTPLTRALSRAHLRRHAVNSARALRPPEPTGEIAGDASRTQRGATEQAAAKDSEAKR